MGRVDSRAAYDFMIQHLWTCKRVGTNDVQTRAEEKGKRQSGFSLSLASQRLGALTLVVALLELKRIVRAVDLAVELMTIR